MGSVALLWQNTKCKFANKRVHVNVHHSTWLVIPGFTLHYPFRHSKATDPWCPCIFFVYWYVCIHNTYNVRNFVSIKALIYILSELTWCLKKNSNFWVGLLKNLPFRCLPLNISLYTFVQHSTYTTSKRINYQIVNHSLLWQASRCQSKKSVHFFWQWVVCGKKAGTKVAIILKKWLGTI